MCRAYSRFPDSASAAALPIARLIFASLKDISQRKGAAHSAQGIIQNVRMPLLSIPQAIVIPFNPPPIQGLSNFGGFQFELQQTGSGSLNDLQNVRQQFHRPRLVNAKT